MVRNPQPPGINSAPGTVTRPNQNLGGLGAAGSSRTKDMQELAADFAPVGAGMIAMSDQEFALFRRWVATTCAMDLADEKRYLLETRLARLLVENQCTSFSQFYALLNGTTAAALRDRVIDAVTTHETTWFRDESVWLALQDEVLPDLLQRCSAQGRAPRIWSAACSTGQEPYSIAMLLDRLCTAHPEWSLRAESATIVGTDISLPALVVAMAGRYDSISMRRGLVGNWESLRAQYFTQNGPVCVLSPDIRRRVVFERQNLQDAFEKRGTFDLILLRYVAIYFASDFKEQLWPRILRVLNEDGRLILGATETLPNGIFGMVAERCGRAYVYRKSDEEGRI